MGFFRRPPTQDPRHDELAAQLAKLRDHVATIARRQHEIDRELAEFRLDYQGLYEKARTTLSKLAKRAKVEGDGEPQTVEAQVIAARRALVARKLNR